MKTRAEELGADLRFGTDVVSLDQDDQGVNAEIRHRDSGATEHVRASYMVAADGAHSRTREQLGIRMHGRGVFSRSLTIYFRADVAPLLRGRNLSVIYVNNAVLRGFFRFEKPFERGFLAVNALGDPDNPITDVATGATEARCIDWVRAALGTDDVPITIENVMPWNAEAQSAERYQDGRIFLAGDAAARDAAERGLRRQHRRPGRRRTSPGSSRWCCSGHADPALLSTYDTERRPVGEFTTEQAYSRYVTRTAPYLGTDGTAAGRAGAEHRARLPLRVRRHLSRCGRRTASRQSP